MRQEKFQVIVPAKEEAGEPWSDFEASRDLRGMVDWVSQDPMDFDNRKVNFVLPGMELHNQCYTQQEQMPLSSAGETDVSQDNNPTAKENGYTVRQMKGADDQYTGEHVDHFYGDNGGFVEKNNYLDRL